jgi:hypothetical protein
MDHGEPPPAETTPPEPVDEEAEPSEVVPADALDSEHAAVQAIDDETPIFRALRSNWLSGDDQGHWASSDVQAGWEAADRVAVAPATQVSDSGLPVRRPGNRLVPGGTAPAPAPIVRDPEAIRARLAAHAAGVSRGRSAAGDPVPADRTRGSRPE